MNLIAPGIAPDRCSGCDYSPLVGGWRLAKKCTTLSNDIYGHRRFLKIMFILEQCTAVHVVLLSRLDILCCCLAERLLCLLEAVQTCCQSRAFTGRGLGSGPARAAPAMQLRWRCGSLESGFFTKQTRGRKCYTGLSGGVRCFYTILLGMIELTDSHFDTFFVRELKPPTRG